MLDAPSKLMRTPESLGRQLDQVSIGRGDCRIERRVTDRSPFGKRDDRGHHAVIPVPAQRGVQRRCRLRQSHVAFCLENEQPFTAMYELIKAVRATRRAGVVYLRHADEEVTIMDDRGTFWIQRTSSGGSGCTPPTATMRTPHTWRNRSRGCWTRISRVPAVKFTVPTMSPWIASQC